MQPTRAELQRRQQQSARDRRRHEREEQEQENRRRQQSERDRARNRREQAQRIYYHTSHLVQEIVTTVNTSSAEAMAPVSDPERVFDNLFNNNKYSDMTIFLGETKFPFPAHRVILGTRCPYLDDVLHSGFKEGIEKEINFEKDSPQALWRVLHYLYTGDYSDESAQSLDSESDDPELLKHPRVFALADMFRIEGLKKLSCKKFEQQLTQYRGFSYTPLPDTFPDCIREVYMTSNSTDLNTTRKVVVDAVILNKTTLLQKGLLQELVQEIGDFAVDLVLEMAKR